MGRETVVFDSTLAAPAETLLVSVVGGSAEPLLSINTVFSTLVGGVLALAGGFLSHWLRVSSEAKRRRSIAERRLELVVLNTAEFWAARAREQGAKIIKGVFFEELIVVCNAFDRVADDLLTGGKPDFETRAMTFASMVRLRAADFRDAEDRWRFLVEQVGVDEEEIKKKRRGAVEKVQKELHEKAELILKELNATRISKASVTLDDLRNAGDRSGDNG